MRAHRLDAAPIQRQPDYDKHVATQRPQRFLLKTVNGLGAAPNSLGFELQALLVYGIYDSENGWDVRSFGMRPVDGTQTELQSCGPMAVLAEKALAAELKDAIVDWQIVGPGLEKSLGSFDFEEGFQGFSTSRLVNAGLVDGP